MAKIPRTLQKLPPLTPVLVDKKTAAQWQINCAIRNIFYGECPISNHLIVMSAREILDQYAKKKGTVLKVEIENYIKPQYVKEARAQWKERYNFLKHSDNDADAITDFTNVQLHNETETFMNILKYTELFRSSTTHMGLFTAYIMARFPDWFNQSGLPLSDEQRQVFRGLNKEKRGNLCDLCKEALERTTQAREELRAVRRISFAEQVKVPRAKKDKDGRYFTHKK